MPPPLNLQPVLEWIGDRHLRIGLGTAISPQAHRRVRASLARVMGAGLPGLTDAVPAYATLLLSFDPASLDPKEVQRLVVAAIGGMDADSDPATDVSTRLVEIPTCYEEEFAPDIDSVAGLHATTAARIAELHAAAQYSVYFIGFSPGFAYLGGLPSQLATPRLDRPRTRVPEGSVGIADDQSGIYPHATPGGWRLIGRTPLKMFDPARASPSLLEMGDRVQFKPISAEEFAAIAATQKAGA